MYGSYPQCILCSQPVRSTLLPTGSLCFRLPISLLPTGLRLRSSSRSMLFLALVECEEAESVLVLLPLCTQSLKPLSGRPALPQEDSTLVFRPTSNSPLRLWTTRSVSCLRRKNFLKSHESSTAVYFTCKQVGHCGLGMVGYVIGLSV